MSSNLINWEANVKMLFLIIFILISCGTEYETVDSVTEQEFVEYKKSFEKACQVDSSDISMVFGDVQTEEHPNRVGYCEISKRIEKNDLGNKVITEKKIVISKAYWQIAPSSYKKILIWHELGHCALEKGHTEEAEEDGTPASIMNPYISQRLVEAYEQNPKAYTEELCQKTKAQKTSIIN